MLTEQEKIAVVKVINHDLSMTEDCIFEEYHTNPLNPDEKLIKGFKGDIQKLKKVLCCFEISLSLNEKIIVMGLIASSLEMAENRKNIFNENLESLKSAYEKISNSLTE